MARRTSLALLLAVLAAGWAVAAWLLALYAAAGFDRLAGLPPLIVGSMIGAWPGVRIRERLGEAVLQRAFAVYMVVIAVLMVVDAANGS
jgi:uncharacterized membrane protein YfcA